MGILAALSSTSYSYVGGPPNFVNGVSDHEFNGPFNDWLNVLDYGADPTGTFDSTVAFQNCINDLWNSAVQFGSDADPNTWYLPSCGYVPSGTYLISDTLYWPSPIATPGGGTLINLYGQDPSTKIGRAHV